MIFFYHMYSSLRTNGAKFANQAEEFTLLESTLKFSHLGEEWIQFRDALLAGEASTRFGIWFLDFCGVDFSVNI